VLTGARPYKVEDVSSPRAYEIAVLEQTPTRPSDAVRADNEIDAAAVRKALRGDLDAIVLKALRKEPNQRYASVADFAADIRHHLAQRPVAARQGNFRYVASRFVRRHAFALTLIAAALGAIIGTAVIAELQRRGAVAAREQAEAEAARANEVTEFMVNVFGNAAPDPATGEQVTAIGLLTAAREQIGAEVEDERTRAAMLTAIGRATFLVHGGHQFSAISQEAVNLRRKLGEPLPLADALRLHVSALMREHRYDEATAAMDEAERLLLPLGAEAEDDRFYNARQHGTILLNQSRMDEAVVVLDEAVARGVASGMAMDDARMIDARNRLGFALVQSADKERGREVLRSVISDLRAQQPVKVQELAAVMNNLGFSWNDQQDLEKAEAVFREAIELRSRHSTVDVVELMHARTNLSRTLGELGRYDEAVREAEIGLAAVLAKQDARISPRELGYPRRLLADLEWRRGNLAKAMDWTDQGIEFALTDAEGSRGRLRTLRFFRAAILIDLGRLSDADAEISAARALIDPADPPGDAVYVDVEATRLALMRGQTPDCSGLERHDREYYASGGTQSSTDIYVLAYTEFCRAVTLAPDNHKAREQLAHWIAWLAQRMPPDDRRVAHLRELATRYFPAD